MGESRGSSWVEGSREAGLLSGSPGRGPHPALSRDHGPLWVGPPQTRSGEVLSEYQAVARDVGPGEGAGGWVCARGRDSPAAGLPHVASPAEQDPERWHGPDQLCLYPPPWMGSGVSTPDQQGRAENGPHRRGLPKTPHPQGPNLGRPKAFRKHQLLVNCSGLETGPGLV